MRANPRRSIAEWRRACRRQSGKSRALALVELVRAGAAIDLNTTRAPRTEVSLLIGATDPLATRTPPPDDHGGDDDDDDDGFDVVRDVDDTLTDLNADPDDDPFGHQPDDSTDSDPTDSDDDLPGQELFGAPTGPPPGGNGPGGTPGGTTNDAAFGTTGGAAGLSLFPGGAPDGPLGWIAGAGRYGGAWTRHGGRLQDGTARLLLCDAVWYPIVIGALGVPLDMGRAVRLATDAQRRAMTARDGGCVFPGCDIPPSHCDAHHVTPYEDGGNTDLHHLAFLCRHHHGITHRKGWTMRATPDSWFTFTSPTGHTTWSQRHYRQREGPLPHTPP